jgi:hypothetical protein
MPLTRPTVLPTWAEAGDKVQPTEAEIQTGWPLTNVPPSRQRFNWLQNYLMNGIRYLARRGVSDWSSDETYEIGDRVIGADGYTYKALVQNTNKTPAANPGEWMLWALDSAQTDSRIQINAPKISAAGGTENALTAGFTPAVTALVNGMSVMVRAAAANTAAATFTPNNGTVAAKPIFKGNNLPILAGDISGAGHWLELQYDSTLDKWALLNPALGIVSGFQAYSISALPTTNIGPIMVIEAQEIWTWVSTAYFTGYRSILCGRASFGHTQSPLAMEVDAVGGTLSKTAYAALWGYAQENSLVVASGSWVAGTHNFVDVDASNFRVPDLRNQFFRMTGTDADTANAVALGAYKADTLKSHTHNVVNWGLAGASGSAQYVSLSPGTTPTSSTGSAETAPRQTAYKPRIHI